MNQHNDRSLLEMNAKNVFILRYRFEAVQSAAASLLRLLPILRRFGTFAQAPANRTHLARLRRLWQMVRYLEGRPRAPSDARPRKTIPVFPLLEALPQALESENSRSEARSSRALTPVFLLREII